jgi:ribosomal protein S18 acetylase RimI-like enzyme
MEEAKKMKGIKIFLYSSSKLQTAIKLYEKYGFQHVAVTDAPFLTADIKMELLLK